MDQEKWFAESTSLPFVDSFTKPCPKCGATMDVKDKTLSKRRMAKILDVQATCTNCKKIIQAAGTHTVEDALQEFDKAYNREVMKATSEIGAYKCEEGYMWNYAGKADVICITTNGATNKEGRAVMGRGCAKQATKRYPDIAEKLGLLIEKHGNRAMKLVRDLTNKDNPTWIVSFPVKPKYKTCKTQDEISANVVEHMRDQFSEKLEGKDRVSVPGWATRANVEIIAESAKQLMAMADKFAWKSIVCPMPGCGAGELDFDTEVKPVLNKILDQRFTLVTYPSKR